MNNFAQEIKRYRETQHLTIQEVAKKIGCSPAVTFYYETGQRCPPFKKMMTIFKKLSISPNVLISPSTPAFPTPALPSSLPSPLIESIPTVPTVPPAISSPPVETTTKG